MQKTATELISIPRQAVPEILPRMGQFAALLSDYDEELTSSVIGPYLVERKDLPPEIVDAMIEKGAEVVDGYLVPIGERPEVIDLIEGDYCAYYGKARILTRSLRVAEALEMASRNAESAPSPQAEIRNGGARGKAGVFERLKDVGQAYADRLLVPEIQISFPLVALFFLLALISFWRSFILFREDPRMGPLLVWSLAPLVTYGLLFFGLVFRTRRFARLFAIRLADSHSPLDLRRIRYTQIFIALIVLFASFGFFDGIAWRLLENAWAEDGLRLALVAFITILAGIALFAIHNKFQDAASRFLVILAIVIIFATTDTPAETIEGRSLFFQTFPIMLSSFIVAPYVSFITAFIAGLILTVRSLGAGLGINSTAYLGFLLIAFLSWLVSTGFEEALRQLQVTNFLLEKRVAERTKQLMDANLGKSKFMAQVAHELQSPIISIGMYLKSIRPAADTPEREAILAETNRLLEMAEKVSAVSKLEIDSLEEKLFPSVLDLQEYVDTALRIFGMHAEMQGIMIEKTAAEGPYRFLGIASYVTRVVDNLLTNALKYTDSGGSVRIRLDRSDGNVRLTVEDNGIGIPAADQARIFERFTRASNTGDRPGSGLGLAMVREMVVAMQGTISLASAPGEGSAFTVTFPAADAAE